MFYMAKIQTRIIEVHSFLSIFLKINLNSIKFRSYVINSINLSKLYPFFFVLNSYTYDKHSIILMHK